MSIYVTTEQENPYCDTHHIANFLTNFGYSSLWAYQQAIIEYKKVDPEVDLYIAEGTHGHRHALYGNRIKFPEMGLNVFWNIFDTLRKEDKYFNSTR